MSYRRGNRIGDRGWLFFMFLFLLMISWSLVIRDRNANGARFDPWRLEPAGERTLSAVDWPALPARTVADLTLPLGRNEPGRPETVFASPDGRVFAEDPAKFRLWEVQLNEPVRSLTLLEWDGDTTFPEIAVGGERGAVMVLDAQGQQLDRWDDWGLPMEDLLGADLDGDGHDDLAAATGGDYLQVFRRGQESLTLPLPSPASRLAADNGLLVVRLGQQARAYKLVKNNLIEQYRPMLGSLIFTLVVCAVALPTMLLHPELVPGQRDDVV